MASTVTTPAQPLPAEQFFRAAVFFLVLTAVLTLVSTGKLDLATTLAAPLAILYKGFRWWRGRAPELKQTTATRLVLAYVFLFPIDALFFSRNLASGTSNSALYAALLAAVHFLLFVTIIRLYSATTDRDAIFLAMLSFAAILASAVFTVDTNFFFLFIVYLLFGVATFLSLEIRRGAFGAVFPQQHPESSRERKFYRAMSLAALSVAVGALFFGSMLFFFFPRFSAGYFARIGFQPSLMTGFTDNVELGRIGEIKQDNSVVMRVRTGAPVNYPMLRWRGVALSTFDGRRWYSSEKRRDLHDARQDGWIQLSSQQDVKVPVVAQLRFIVDGFLTRGEYQHLLNIRTNVEYLVVKEDAAALAAELRRLRALSLIEQVRPNHGVRGFAVADNARRRIGDWFRLIAAWRRVPADAEGERDRRGSAGGNHGRRSLMPYPPCRPLR